jgi:hypothetical protein
MIFERLQNEITENGLPATPMVIKYNESYVRDRGNYNVITDMAVQLASILQKDGQAIASEMLSSDYANLLAVWAREFNHVVVIQALTASELAEFSGV